MNLRVTIYWLLSLLLLVLCLTYSSHDHDQKNKTYTSLTSYFKGALNSFYFSDNLFHVTVVGQLVLEIEVDQIENDISDYNVLVIDQYDFNQNIELSLNWEVDGSPNKLVLNQSKSSATPIDFQTNDSDKISNLHLQFSSIQELGIQPVHHNEISFQSIRLDYLSEQSPLITSYSKWVDFNAVKFSTINSYTNGRDLNLKSLVLRLSCWITINIILFWLFKINGFHLITTLVIAWLVGDYFFIGNHIRQNHQIEQSFSEDQKYLNLTDKEVYELAQQISKQLNTASTEFKKTDHLVLLGNNSFQNLRLLYHLSSFNSAMNFDMQNLLNTQKNRRVFYLLTFNQRVLCEDSPENKWLYAQIELVHVNDEFCLMRKK